MQTLNFRASKLGISISLLTLLIAGCNDGKQNNPVAPPPTVQVSVQASNANGNALKYEWKSTDGVIANVNASTTTWTLPTGPGLHFAYVLVSNGKGGYTERRIVVSSNDIGVPTLTRSPVNFDALAGVAPIGNYYRGIVRTASNGMGAQAYYSSDPNIYSGIPNVYQNSLNLLVKVDNSAYIPDAEVYLADTNTGVSTTKSVTDLRGYFTIQNVASGFYNMMCASDFTRPFLDCIGSPREVRTESIINYYDGNTVDRLDIVGRVVLSDGGPCGTLNEFFNKSISARVSLLNASGAVIDGSRRVNEWGHYGLTTQTGATSVRFECEGVPPVVVPISTLSTNQRTVLPNTGVPIITSMTATLNGSLLPATTAKFLPPPTSLPSDNLPGSDVFLAFKGIDSRLSACQYYLKIGAVRSCDVSGNFSGAISFDDWKRKTKMEPYAAAGRKDIVATYVNKVDLNLTRNHHSISYGADQTSAYVCNHLGPTDDTQGTLDAAIDNAINGKSLVACVAMDHHVTAGVNGGKAFTRFLIFGPSGELLPSINLDGRTEKFVPGVCVACHGGDKYAGRFPEDGTGYADIGAHFLPYDTGNFGFSSKAGLTEADQEAAIYTLNQNVLLASSTPATTELIQGWYAAGNQTLNKNYLPSSWQGQPPEAISYYHNVYAKSCRTCHVAFTEELNFDHYSNVSTFPPSGQDIGSNRISNSSCVGSSFAFVRNYSMPNSLTTMNLYWNSAGTLVDQPAITAAFLDKLNSGASGFTNCILSLSPIP